jgi:TRAP-type C4-dicarboxylate transport system permease small subunit
VPPDVSRHGVSPAGAPNAVQRLIVPLNRAIDKLAHFMCACAGWLFVICALFITFDVLARKFLGFSSQSTTELSGYMLGIGIAWGLAGALDARAHVRIDVLIQRVPSSIRGYLHWMALATLVVFIGFLVYGAWQTFMESWEFKATDNSLLKTPLIIPQGLWLFGIGVFGVMALLRVIQVMALLPRRDIQAIEMLTGPRSFVEEADEALEAIGAEQHLTATAAKPHHKT